MKKPIFAQIKAEQTKARLTEILTAQIERLLDSEVFGVTELLDIFRKQVSTQYAYSSDAEVVKACKESILKEGGFLIDEVNYMQEIALKDFCKENDIKLLEYYDL